MLKAVWKSVDNGFVGKDGFIMGGKEVPNMESTAVDPELCNVKYFDTECKDKYELIVNLWNISTIEL